MRVLDCFPHIDGFISCESEQVMIQLSVLEYYISVF